MSRTTSAARSVGGEVGLREAPHRAVARHRAPERQHDERHVGGEQPDQELGPVGDRLGEPDAKQRCGAGSAACRTSRRRPYPRRRASARRAAKLRLVRGSARHELPRRLPSRPARGRAGGTAAPGPRRRRPLRLEGGEEVLRDHERPHVRVVEGASSRRGGRTTRGSRCPRRGGRACSAPSSAATSRGGVEPVGVAAVQLQAHRRVRTSAGGRSAPCPNSSGRRRGRRTSSAGMRLSGLHVAREARSTAGSRTHSSRSCEGASTKSHSVATPEWALQRVWPPRTWWSEVAERRGGGCARSARSRSAGASPGAGSCRPSTPSGSRRPAWPFTARELREVLVLALARVHVEPDAAERATRPRRRRRPRPSGCQASGASTTGR